MYNFTVDDEHFKYLYVQTGDIAHIPDRFNWHTAYNRRMNRLYESLKPFLPKKCESILDIGSGLGGIDVLLSRHYRGGANVELLDGESDRPIVNKHAETFSNHIVMADFLTKNGVENFSLSSPQKYDIKPRDLIVSFSAYCFHIPVDTYLKLITESSHEDTVCIFRIRDGKNYLDVLKQYFPVVRIVNNQKKGDIVCLSKNTVL
jgi:hypothetical protein